jgi:tetratricopeptide (TPR) repeat protein
MLMQRRALSAVALALTVVAPSRGDAQSNRNLPGADTPRLLVVVFQSPQRGLGVEIADAVRTRMTSSANPRQLYLIPREQMVNFLESSGYKADSSLGSTDAKELAKGLRADYLVGGVISKSGTSFKIEPRLMLAVDPSVGQPLPVIETGSLNDAGRQIERSYLDARRQLDDDRACKNHIRSGAVDKAIVAANAGIAKYSNAVIARLCLANAFQVNKMWDSVLTVTNVILKLDPQSKLASQFAITAYKEKADAMAATDSLKSQEYREASVKLLVQLLAIEPYNQSLQNSVITELAKLGKPSVAIPIVESLLKQNPGDPALLRQRWQLMSADAASADSATKAAKIDRMLAAGEDMIKADTMLADSTYFFRQVAAAMAASPQKGIEWTSRAVQKYPTNQDYWWYKASQERKAGQTQAASQSLSRLLILNPKYPDATVMLGQLYIDQGMNDSAIAVARRSVANGEPKATWGRFLVGPTNAQYQKAAAADQAATADSANKDKRAVATTEFEATLALAQESDKMSPTPQSKFFIGVSSFQIGYAMVNRVQATQAALAKAQGSKTPPKPAEVSAQRASMCTDAKRAQDMFLLTMTNMPAGGSVEPRVAQQLLGATGQMSPFADQAATTFCRALPATPPATKAAPPPR